MYIKGKPHREQSVKNEKLPHHIKEEQRNLQRGAAHQRVGAWGNPSAW